MEKRLALKGLRCSRDLSQEEMALKLGVSRGTYGDIENGQRDGSVEFWKALETEFDLKESEVWRLMKNEPEESEEAQLQNN